MATTDIANRVFSGVYRFFRVPPGDGDEYVGLRNALGIFIPMAVIVLMNRYDLAMYVVFGAFVGVYSRPHEHLDRFLVQVKAAGLMAVVVFLAWLAGEYVIQGAHTIEQQWMLTWMTVAIAGVSTVIAGAVRLKPPVPIFSMFAFSAIASSAELPYFSDAMVATGATIALAIFLGQVGRAAPRFRTPIRIAGHELTRAELAVMLREAAEYMAACAIGGGLAIGLSSVFGFGHVYWALVVSAVPLLSRGMHQRLRRSAHRVLGTLTGLLLLAAILLINPSAWMIVIILGLFQFFAELFITRNYFWAQVFITPMALIGSNFGAPIPPSTMFDRAYETFIGVAAGLIVVVGTALWSKRRAALTTAATQDGRAVLGTGSPQDARGAVANDAVERPLSGTPQPAP